MNWNQLEQESQLDNLIKLSKEKPVVIFKHSTSCGISRMVLKSFEKELSDKDSIISSLYFLDLLKFRSISNKVADVFDVIHQSPQLLIIENGIAVHHSSHYSIETKSIK